MAKKGKKKSTKAKNKQVKQAKTVKKVNITKQELETRRRVNFEIINIIFVALAIFLFASNFGYCGAIGNIISDFLVGVLGTVAYLLPFIILTILLVNNYSKVDILEKNITMIVLVILLCAIIQCAFADEVSADTIKDYINEFYTQTKNINGTYARNIGGGVFGGLIYLFLATTVAKTGAYIVLFFLVLICFVILTRKPLMSIFAKSTTSSAVAVTKEVGTAAASGYNNAASYVNDYFKDIQNTKFINDQGFDYDEPNNINQNMPNMPNNFNMPNMQNVPNMPGAAQQNFPNNINPSYFDPSSVNIQNSNNVGNNNGYQFTNPSFLQSNKFNQNDISPNNFNNNSPLSNLNFDEIEMKKRMEETRKQALKKAEQQIPYRFDNIDDSVPFDLSYKKEGTDPNITYSENNNSYESQNTSSKSEYINAREVPPPDALSTKERLLRKYRERMGKSATTGANTSQKSSSSLGMGTSLQKSAPSSKDPGTTSVSSVKKRHRAYTFPPLNLLKRGLGSDASSNSKQIKDACANLENLFAQFKIGIRVVDVTVGPSVLRYEIELAQGIPVKTISKYTDDIKLALKVESVRISPIAEKGLVGIEVPNKNSQIVALGDLLSTKEFKDGNGELVFALGKDLGGKNIFTDIDKMPHLLIAGATGSGKSVCVNTLILSLLYKYKPDDVKLIMIDPKMVELQGYNGIPHLLIPVVTDARKATNALNWVVNEMELRYKLFSGKHVRNLNEYNRSAEEKLPRIVIIIDEFADLMMVASKEVENAVVRISQLARAAGLHLVIATQRPSVNVITGVIKANILSRIAFAVSSGIDSRTILDMEGAEKLLGKGDMLFYPTGSPKPVRIQGCFVSNKEINDVIDYIKVDGDNFDSEILDKIENGSQGSNMGSTGSDTSSSGLDSSFNEIGLFAIAQGTIAIGTIQRKFSMGFNRAARIIDQLEENGVIGPADGKKAREILMSEMEFRERFGA